MAQFMSLDEALDVAAQEVAEADALLIGAGAGMGVDSGQPDFRGTQGFWRAYPMYQKLGLEFMDLANPEGFAADPTLAWGFYGHRRNLYRAAQPHQGFSLLKAWAERMRYGAFVFTSNVDGQFQRAGFAEERIMEVHGSIHWMQCTQDCGVGLYPAEPSDVSIDESTMRAHAPLPSCPGCTALARPNILMFGDGDWDSSRTVAQRERLEAWLDSMASIRLVIIECGAGLAIPSVRHFCEQIAFESHGTLIRINPSESSVPRGQISLPLGALPALQAIHSRLSRSSLPDGT